VEEHSIELNRERYYTMSTNLLGYCNAALIIVSKLFSPNTEKNFSWKWDQRINQRMKDARRCSRVGFEPTAVK
jgi:hypothetical protein